MRMIYLDQAATAFPKAPGVGAAMKRYIEQVGVNVNRGVYGQALSAEETLLESREALCRLFHFPHPQNVIFTLNITYALNMLLKGILRPGDHCIVSSLEHNAVMRPLTQLTHQGVTFSRIPADQQGRTDLLALEKLLLDHPSTKAVILTHASNVCGIVLPLRQIGEICKKHGVLLIVDSAQTAGSLPIHMDEVPIDALAFTGHKGLLGPQGVGGFLLSKTLATDMVPLISGGTGSLSDREEVPPFMPDKFEAGTPNIPGIFGLHAALSYLEKEGIPILHHQAMERTAEFLEGIKNIQGIRLVGTDDLDERTSVVSLDFINKDNGEIAYTLDKIYGVMTRSGLHCAPYAHMTLGTFPQGTVRFSFSHANTAEEVQFTLAALSRLA